MTTNYKEGGLSLQESAHINVNALRTTGWTFTIFITISLIIIWVIIWGFFNFDNQVQTTTVKQENGTEKIAISYNKSETPALFLVIENYSPIVIFLILGTPIIIWHLYKYQQVFKKFLEWDKDYLRRAYFLNVETSAPQGQTTAEQVHYLARSIFPELRHDYSLSLMDRIKWSLKRKSRKSNEDRISESTNYVVKSYTLDLALNTPEGYFIVKDFGDKMVTLKDIEQLIDVVMKLVYHISHSDSVLRIICVGKEYDKSFMQRESLEQQMKKGVLPWFKRIFVNRKDYPIDLLVKEKTGYSILWID